MIEFLLSPVLSLFSPRFYQKVLKSSLAKGLFYLVYLSLLGALAFLLIILLKWMPTVDNFVAWLASEMPAITFENGGLSTSVSQPHTITHPKFGKIIILNTTKEKLEPSEIREAFVYVTKHLIYVSNPLQKETRIFDISEARQQKNVPPGPHVLTGDLLKKAYDKIKPVFFGVLFGFTFLFIFLWKFVAAILYSLVAVLLNLFRDEGFPYEKLLNVSIFSMSAVTLLQFLNAIVTSIHAPVPLWVALVLTTCYLGLSILVVSPPEKSPE